MDRVVVFLLLYVQFFIFFDLNIILTFFGYTQEMIQSGLFSVVTTPLIFSFYAIDIVFLLVHRKKILGLYKEQKNILIILLICVLSLLWINSKMLSIGISNTILLVGAYIQILTFSLIIAQSKIDIHKFLKIISATILFASIIYNILYPGRVYSMELVGRYQGFTTSPNNLAQLMTIVFITWYNPKNIFKLDILTILVVGISTFLIYLTESATGILIVLVTILFYISPKLNNSKTVGLAFILVFTASISAVFFLRSDEKIRIGKIERNLTFTGRTKIWSNVTDKQIKDDKIILGYGYRGFWDVKHGASNNMTDTFKENIQQSHNGFLEVYIQFGILSLIIFYLLFKQLKINTTNSKTLTLIVICFLINNFSESILLQPRHHFWKLALFTIVFISVHKIITVKKAHLISN